MRNIISSKNHSIIIEHLFNYCFEFAFNQLSELCFAISFHKSEFYICFRYYCPRGTALATENPCPAGTYTDAYNLTSRDQCTQCPPRFACLSGKLTVLWFCWSFLTLAFGKSCTGWIFLSPSTCFFACGSCRSLRDRWHDGLVKLWENYWANLWQVQFPTRTIFWLIFRDIILYNH